MLDRRRQFWPLKKLPPFCFREKGSDTGPRNRNYIYSNFPHNEVDVCLQALLNCFDLLCFLCFLGYSMLSILISCISLMLFRLWSFCWCQSWPNNPGRSPAVTAPRAHAKSSVLQGSNAFQICATVFQPFIIFLWVMEEYIIFISILLYKTIYIHI